eukprot:653964_1
MASLLSLRHISHLSAVLLLTFSVVHCYCSIQSYEFIGTNTQVLLNTDFAHCKTTCESNNLCNYLSFGQVAGYMSDYDTCLMFTSYDSFTHSWDATSVTYMCTTTASHCCTINQLTNNGYCLDPTSDHTTFDPQSSSPECDYPTSSTTTPATASVRATTTGTAQTTHKTDAVTIVIAFIALALIIGLVFLIHSRFAGTNGQEHEEINLEFENIPKSEGKSTP